MIGKLLGHTQVQTTARYTHLARDSIQNAAARITGASVGICRQFPRPKSPPDTMPCHAAGRQKRLPRRVNKRNRREAAYVDPLLLREIKR